MKENWTYKPFLDCIESVKYTAKVQSKDYTKEGKYPIISQEDKYISGFWNNDEEVFRIPRPVVIFGDHTRVIKYVDFDFVLGADGVKILLPKENMLAKFMYYFLQWYKIPNLGYSRHFKLFKDISIPLPPLSEQQSIVRELDLLNDLIAKKRAQVAEYDQLQQSLFYTIFGDPVTNEKGWEVKKLGEVAPIKKYEGPIYEKEGKVWLLNLDMIESQTGNICDYLWEKESEIGNSTTTFNENYVLYSKLRPYLNKVVIPKHSGYCTTELLPLLPSKVLHKTYLAFCLRSKSFVDYINIKVAGAKMPRVTMDDFRGFSLPLPPLPLQQEFAKKVEAIEALKEKVNASIKETETLLAARMDYYFG